MHADECRCPDCWGLREAMLEITGKDYGLEPAPGRVASSALDGPKPPGSGLRLVKPCDGSYTCPCDSCTQDKVRASGGRASLPWEDDFSAAA